jgi:hypothetical protein
MELSHQSTVSRTSILRLRYPDHHAYYYSVHGNASYSCADIERVYQDNQKSGNGNSEVNLQMVRSVFSGRNSQEYGQLTNFEEFCARYYEGGSSYSAADAKFDVHAKDGQHSNGEKKAKENIPHQKNWNGVSIGRLLCGRM